MSGEIAYKLTADEKQAVDAIMNVAKAMGEGEKATKGLTEETKQLQREQAEMGRIAKRAIEDAKTPLEKYNEQVLKLTALLHDGKIKQEEYGLAVKKAKEEMQQAGRRRQGQFWIQGPWRFGELRYRHVFGGRGDRRG